MSRGVTRRSPWWASMLALAAACSTGGSNATSTPPAASTPPLDVTIVTDATVSTVTTGPDSTGPDPTSAPTENTLPTVQLSGTFFGYAVDAENYLTNPQYGAIVHRDATIITPENELKWSRVHPERDVYDFEAIDELVVTARTNREKVRGHVLIWHRQLPDWLENGDWTRDELIEIMREHIDRVVGRYERLYPKVITQWDVVNEAFTSEGERRDSIWQRVIGDDYIELAFRFAREAAPDALLFYNDYYDDAIVSGGDPDRNSLGASPRNSQCDDIPKCAATKQMAAEFVEAGVPIDGIGFEAHIFDVEPPDYATFSAWTQPLGLVWALTEMDVALPAGSGDDPVLLDAQAEAYGSMVDDCIESPNCNTMVVWGVSDNESWIPRESDGERDHALLYGRSYEPKPAATRVLDAIAAASE